MLLFPAIGCNFPSYLEGKREAKRKARHFPPFRFPLPSFLFLTRLFTESTAFAFWVAAEVQVISLSPADGRVISSFARTLDLFFSRSPSVSVHHFQPKLPPNARRDGFALPCLSCTTQFPVPIIWGPRRARVFFFFFFFSHTRLAWSDGRAACGLILLDVLLAGRFLLMLLRFSQTRAKGHTDEAKRSRVGSLYSSRGELSALGSNFVLFRMLYWIQSLAGQT